MKCIGFNKNFGLFNINMDKTLRFTDKYLGFSSCEFLFSTDDGKGIELNLNTTVSNSINKTEINYTLDINDF